MILFGRRFRPFSITSFRTKLTLVSVLCILLPALVTLVVYNLLTRDAVKEQAVSGAKQTLELIDGHVSNTLEYMTYLLNYIQEDIDLKMALKQLNDTVYSEDRLTNEQYTTGSVVRYKIDSLTAAGESVYLTIVLPNGMYFTNYPAYEYAPARILKEPWLRQANGVYGYHSYWPGTLPTQFLSEKGRNPYQLTVVRALRNQSSDNSTIYAYVVVTIMESRIHRYFERLAAGQEVMLLDRDDRVLSHTDAGHIGTDFAYLKQAEGEPERDIVRRDGTDYLISQHPISFSVNGWKLVSLTPYRTAVTKINAIFQNVFLFQLVSFVLFFILLMVALRAFTKPLVKLDKVAVEVQKGDLSVRSSIRGMDEIGRLGKSFDGMLERISDMIEEITQTQARKRKAELSMLQAQINPHFLFNVLNSIRMKVLGRGDRESAEMIASLSKLLRMTIQDQGSIPLHDEVETVIDYMKLMNMRQKETAVLEVDIAPEVYLERVPRFFLQPLIENALIHGLNQQAGTVFLEASPEEADLIRIRVRDTGQGMDAEKLERLRRRLSALPGEEAAGPDKKGFSSIGLSNVYERMRMTFGERFRMVIDSTEGAGTVITMYIPKQEEAEPHVQGHAGG
ncbi:histidine kinase [Paenibacillus mucilaginosus 3016]|uniref:Histidine kinase n=1 Tax=Paenibacillus mucilaginosus 3016 TaxID=1116391 RepID=H6NA89_9BACL|nr:sensor histidine kinase [Paenibacillus mucilaginosus]AFC29335.1 histidine kinase [Paenibacillus mucilaginosus 3016]WFA18053.1 sensor histidine kinase [Paenibacillus mucilaginosus]